MLTKLFVRDETTASLGKTEHTFIAHDSGEKINLHELTCRRVTQKAEKYTLQLRHRDFFTLLNLIPRMSG